MRKEIEESKILFFQNEFRTVNYFTVKSSMGDTNNIKQPSDLYSISSEETELSEASIAKLNAPLTENDWKIINSIT